MSNNKSQLSKHAILQQLLITTLVLSALYLGGCFHVLARQELHRENNKDAVYEYTRRSLRFGKWGVGFGIGSTLGDRKLPSAFVSG